MMKSAKTDLSNQVVSLLLSINNESESTGLYKVRRDTIPKVYLRNCSIPHIVRNHYVYAQDLTEDLTLSFWNTTVYKILLRCIIVQLNEEQEDTLKQIANYLSLNVDLKRMYVLPKEPKYASRRYFSS